MLLVQAGAMQPSASPAPVAIQDIRSVALSAGTQIRFVTDAELHSKSLIQGQRFTMTVAEDVMAGQVVAIPRGTAAVGEVESLSETGMFGKSAKFTLRPLFIELAGKRINLDGLTPRKGDKAVTEAAIATVLTGGLGVFITGKSARLPGGSIIMGTVRNDTVIAPLQR
jgi:hypothetical protein